MNKITKYTSFFLGVLCLLLSQQLDAQNTEVEVKTGQQDNRIRVRLFHQHSSSSTLGSMEQDFRVSVTNLTQDKLLVHLEYSARLSCGTTVRTKIGVFNEGVLIKPSETKEGGYLSGTSAMATRLTNQCSKDNWIIVGKSTSGNNLYSMISDMDYQVINIENISEKERKEAAKKEKEHREVEEKKEKERKEKEEKKQTSSNHTDGQKSITENAINDVESKSVSSSQNGFNDIKEGDNRTQQQKIKDEYEEVKKKSDEKYRIRLEEFQKKEEDNRIFRERQNALVTETVQTLAPVAGELLAPVGAAVDDFLAEVVGKTEILSLTMGIGKVDNASYYNLKLFNYVVNTKYVQPSFGFGLHAISYPQYTFTYPHSVPDKEYNPSNNETMSIGKRIGLNIPFGIQGVIPLIKGETHNFLSFNWELSSAINLWTFTSYDDSRIPDGDNDTDGIHKMTPTLPFIQLTGGIEINFSRSFGIGMSIGMSSIPFEETVTGYINDNNGRYNYQATAVNNEHFNPIFMFKFFKFSY